MPRLTAKPLTRDAFEPFGDVIEVDAALPNHPINAGTTRRYHDLGTAVATGEDARVILSMARAQPFALPHRFTQVERHPFGSQAFVPVAPARVLVVVAPDEDGTPGEPVAFLAEPGQGINYFANVWHMPLAVLDQVTDFLVVDREGAGTNLETFDYPDSWEVVP